MTVIGGKGSTRRRNENSVRRCAVYTRKSTDDGLEQDFNSLHAQREACEAYVRSQAGEGWKLLPDPYDDGGFSGGTMDRPALARLLADIEAKKIDTIIVYKVDRLTRSLADFSRIVDVLDAHDVSFVSITQQFNTTTSMGRLTLNMLLSFAQFEREVTGERIRDKIAASKRKGMWMGGFVPLGYEPDGRTLTINEVEARTVRTIFQLYLELGNVRHVKQAADDLGLTTKVRRPSDGKAGGSEAGGELGGDDTDGTVTHTLTGAAPDAGRQAVGKENDAPVTKRSAGGRPLSRGYIYKLLGNPLYVGCIAHKGEIHEGLHPAIIDRATWDAVQQKLISNRGRKRSIPTRKTEPSPLMGKLFDADGHPLTPSHAVKSGRRYRYYVSRHLVNGTVGENTTDSGWRLPAREIERITADAITALISTTARLAEAARDSGIPADRIGALLGRVSASTGPGTGITSSNPGPTGIENHPLVLVDRVVLGTDRIEITLDLSSMTGLPDITITHHIPTCIRRRGVEMRLVLDGPDKGEAPANHDPRLIRCVVQAHAWFDDLKQGRAATLSDIARSESVSDRHISQVLPLAFLAPDITGAILAGRQPPELTAETLIKRIDLPLHWDDQRTLLGFS
jgi:DNA invertase Pin-like site-specific DNA recombinase